MSRISLSNTNNDGPGSLRQAILDANASGAFGGTVYRVRAIGPAGPSSFTAIDAATTIVYLDASLSGVTIKAEDVIRLRSAVNAMRAAANLAPITFTDATLAGQPVRRVHLMQLRAAIESALDALSIPRMRCAPQRSNLSINARRRGVVETLASRAR